MTNFKKEINKEKALKLIEGIERFKESCAEKSTQLVVCKEDDEFVHSVKEKLLFKIGNLITEAKKKLQEKKNGRFTAKGEKQVKAITKSEEKAGHSPKEAKSIACATATKQGNRKEGK